MVMALWQCLQSVIRFPGAQYASLDASRQSPSMWWTSRPTRQPQPGILHLFPSLAIMAFLIAGARDLNSLNRARFMDAGILSCHFQRLRFFPLAPFAVIKHLSHLTAPLISLNRPPHEQREYPRVSRLKTLLGRCCLLKANPPLEG